MKCFLDLDGVLVNFVGGAIKAHNLPNFYADPINHGNWDFDKLSGLSANAFWKPLGKAFWEGLDWLPDGSIILKMIEEAFGRENICILSSPPSTEGAIEGKREWVRRHIPDYHRRLFIANEKHHVAHPGATLIDDKDSNVVEFKRAGGNAIIVPRLWNSHHGILTIPYLVRSLT